MEELSVGVGPGHVPQAETTVDGLPWKYQKDMNDEQRRVVRVMWLIENITKKHVETAIQNKLVEPGSLEFIDKVHNIVEDIQAGKTDIKELTRLMQMRIEDIYRWSQPHAQFSVADMRKIAGWCRRDGHIDMAKDIEQAIKEREGVRS